MNGMLGYLICMLPPFLAVWAAQAMVKASYRKWSKVANSRRISGAQVAQELMRAGGVHNVALERTSGELSDHYDPRSNTLRLSPDVGDGRSVSSLAIAAHEVGHVMQDHTGFVLLKLRSGLVPAVTIGSRFGYALIMIGLLLSYFITNSDLGFYIALLGLAGFSMSAVFALATLPVEFDASRRAMNLLSETGLVMDSDERRGARAVLTAAALTYVAALGAALAQVLYYAFRIFGMRRR